MTMYTAMQIKLYGVHHTIKSDGNASYYSYAHNLVSDLTVK